MHGERIFFNHGGVLVSNARFVTLTTTYAMAQITSVRTAADPERPEWSVGAAIFGVLGLGCGGVLGVAGRFGFGALFALLGLGLAVLAYGSKFLRRYYVVISTASGEVTALTGDNWPMIASVAQAVSNALIARG